MGTNGLESEEFSEVLVNYIVIFEAKRGGDKYLKRKRKYIAESK